MTFLHDPYAKQNATKGTQGEWRVAPFYNEIYCALLLNTGQPFSDADRLPDPSNFSRDVKLKTAAVRRVKDMLATVGQAVQYASNCWRYISKIRLPAAAVGSSL